MATTPETTEPQPREGHEFSAFGGEWPTGTLVDVPLAHPVYKDPVTKKVRLGGPGDSIRVGPPEARGLISSGYAAVDPSDVEAVGKILGTTEAEAAVVTTTPTPAQTAAEKAQAAADADAAAAGSTGGSGSGKK